MEPRKPSSQVVKQYTDCLSRTPAVLMTKHDGFDEIAVLDTTRIEEGAAAAKTNGDTCMRGTAEEGVDAAASAHLLLAASSELRCSLHRLAPYLCSSSRLSSLQIV
eukprot:4969268-Pleurochrysis_carterae.AAC.2